MLQMEMITALSDKYSAPACDYPQCGCLGYGYVPVQTMEDIYDCCAALDNGTIFPELALDITEYGKVCKKWGGVRE